MSPWPCACEAAMSVMAIPPPPIATCQPGPNANSIRRRNAVNDVSSWREYLSSHPRRCLARPLRALAHREAVEKHLRDEFGIGVQVRLAGAATHQLGKQGALGHRKAAGADRRQEQVPVIDAAKLAGRNPLLDHRGDLVAGAVDEIVAQLPRGFRLAVDDPLDDEMMQRRVLVERPGQNENE